MDDERMALIGRIDAMVNQFEGLDHDDGADTWAVVGSVVGELAGVAKGEVRIAAELRRQVARLEGRVQTLEAREQVLLDDVIGRRILRPEAPDAGRVFIPPAG